MVDNIAVIQATLAPVFLVTGAALFVNVTQQRLFRVVDRVMKGTAIDATHAVRDARRLLFLRNAVLLGFTTIALTIATIITLLVPSLLPGTSVGAWPILILAVALAAFAAGIAFAFVDATVAVRNARRVNAARQEALRTEM